MSLAQEFDARMLAGAIVARATFDGEATCAKRMTRIFTAVGIRAPDADTTKSAIALARKHDGMALVGALIDRLTLDGYAEDALQLTVVLAAIYQPNQPSDVPG